MISLRRKHFLNLCSFTILALWVVMVGLLVKKHHFTALDEVTDTVQLTPTIDSAQRDWKEIYYKGRKVGYAVSLIKPFAEGYFIHEEIFLKLNLTGLTSVLRTQTQCRVDKKFLLRTFYFNMNSGVVDFRVSGRVEDDELLLETGREEDRRTQRIKLSKPPMMGAGMGHFFKYRKLTVGDTFTAPLFDPSAMAQKDILIKVAGKQLIKIRGITYKAFRLETEMWGKPMTFWLNEDGEVLKEEGFMGLTTIKSSAARAPRELEGEGGMDFYELAAVGVDRRLADSTRLRYLKVHVEGLDPAILDPDVFGGGRQRVTGGVVEITREKPPFKVSYSLPYDDADGLMKAYLEPEFNIESDASVIVERAREIAGKEKNPIVVAKKLLGWVYHNLEKRPVVAVPSAVGVLRTRVGDCNEHATLLTALLRACGIPARLSVGLVYTRGKFFYHAWAEAFVGEWISMDATLNQMPTDATHIKLIEGNLRKQVEIAGLIGRLSMKVMDYRI